MIGQFLDDSVIDKREYIQYNLWRPMDVIQISVNIIDNFHMWYFNWISVSMLWKIELYRIQCGRNEFTEIMLSIIEWLWKYDIDIINGRKSQSSKRMSFCYLSFDFYKTKLVADHHWDYYCHRWLCDCGLLCDNEIQIRHNSESAFDGYQLDKFEFGIECLNKGLILFIDQFIVFVNKYLWKYIWVLSTTKLIYF